MYAGGHDSRCQLGFKSKAIDKHKSDCINSFLPVGFETNGIQCLTGGAIHSVIIKNKSLFATGSNIDFRIGSDQRKIYEKFTKIKICDEPISWAACGDYFTLYLTESGKVISKNRRKNPEPNSSLVSKKAVSVFAGERYGAIIDEEGAIIRHDSQKRFFLGVPAVDLVCCRSFMCALSKDGRVFMNRSGRFEVDISLNGKKIEKISGYDDTCAALTSDGRVFICGKNNYGQIGNGTTTDEYAYFIKVQSKEEFKDVSCTNHTLFLTKSNKIYGCGNNDHYQLFKKTSNTKVLSPIFIVSIEADQVVACHNYSFILSGTGKLLNPARSFQFVAYHDLDEEEEEESYYNYGNRFIPLLEQPLLRNNDVIRIPPTINQEYIEMEPEEESEDVITELSMKIDCILALCHVQSRSINHLVKICSNLQQQNEINNKKIDMMQKSMEEIKLNQEKQSQMIDTLSGGIDSAIDYIIDQEDEK